MTYREKLDFLETLTRIPQSKRSFFYTLYGVDDGVFKSPEEISGEFKMSPEMARKYYQDMLGIHHIHYASCVTRDPFFDLMTELMDFLNENEQNRKEREKTLSI